MCRSVAEKIRRNLAAAGTLIDHGGKTLQFSALYQHHEMKIKVFICNGNIIIFRWRTGL
jgi:hypothetical protein